MRLFVSSLTSETSPTPPIEKVPIGLSYVSTRSTTTGTGNHIQGIMIDEPNDRVYISWTGQIACYQWSDLSYLFSSNVSVDHFGDITMVGDYIYVMTIQDKVLYEFNKSDLSVNRSVNTVGYTNYVGAFSYDENTGKLWGGYDAAGHGGNGVMQEVNLNTLNPVIGSTMTWINKSDPTDFGGGFQSFSFMNNSPNYIAFCNYNEDYTAPDGSNVSFANMNTLDYQLVRNFQKPIDYGVCVLGDKLYLIQKGGGTSTSITDVLEFDIIYE